MKKNLLSDYSLQLTPGEIQLLDYRMFGKSYPEISRLVGCANSTARARLLKIGKRYINIQNKY